MDDGGAVLEGDVAGKGEKVRRWREFLQEVSDIMSCTGLLNKIGNTITKFLSRETRNTQVPMRNANDCEQKFE